MSLTMNWLQLYYGKGLGVQRHTPPTHLTLAKSPNTPLRTDSYVHTENKSVQTIP